MNKRGPFQGIRNIVNFNWPFYAFSLFIIIVAFSLFFLAPKSLSLLLAILGITAVCLTLNSLFASWIIYDQSNLYQLNFLDPLNLNSNSRIANVNAGFDESSPLIKSKYNPLILDVFDFYSEEEHTEPSIARARKIYPSHPGTKKINTSEGLPSNELYDCILFFLSAHEIRSSSERTQFFKKLKMSMKSNGKIVVVEHLRDFQNFFAFNIGFLHFHSRKSWLRNFNSAGFVVQKEQKITLFLSCFTISKNGMDT